MIYEQHGVVAVVIFKPLGNRNHDLSQPDAGRVDQYDLKNGLDPYFFQQRWTYKLSYFNSVQLKKILRILRTAKNISFYFLDWLGHTKQDKEQVGLFNSPMANSRRDWKQIHSVFDLSDWFQIYDIYIYINPSSPKGVATTPKQFSPRFAKTRSQGLKLLHVPGVHPVSSF